MAFLLNTEIVINATPNKVWAILTDFKNYPNWNPFITSLTGDFEIGKKIIVRIEPPEVKASTFKAIVTGFEVNEKISWFGIFIMRGFFDGEHNFELTDNGNGTTTLVQYENFTGILVLIFKKH
ncbi:SRPBCC domain-containing protein [Flavobacterium sp. 140616W15]|uniref:SRPBCC domain-containing protein n=1 Tax=Flavobacterium sp. 140616W15 TaxID=2478552 RepID=UPI001F5C959D|nr:SRPBCC domain-containing protein [Flavobacterium sp. 140616W15]